MKAFVAVLQCLTHPGWRVGAHNDKSRLSSRARPGIHVLLLCHVSPGLRIKSAMTKSRLRRCHL